MSDPTSKTTRRFALLGTAALPIADWLYSGPSPVLSSMTMATTITFSASGISINSKTGEVTIPEGLSMSDASRAFWNGLHDAFPSMEWCKK